MVRIRSLGEEVLHHGQMLHQQEFLPEHLRTPGLIPKADLAVLFPPRIFNLSVNLAHTEYVFVIPAQTRKIDISIHGGDSAIFYRVAYEPGRVAGAFGNRPFLQFLGNHVYYAHNVFNAKSVELYLSCSVNNRVFQIEAWGDWGGV